jgi:iron complex outermembrane receptor protein
MAQARAGRRSTRPWLASGTGNLSLGDYTLTSVTGYAWFETNSLVGLDQDIPGGGVSQTLVGVSWPEKFDQYSQELRITSPAGRTFEYIAGVYYDQSQYWMGGGLNYDLLGGALQGIEHNDFNQLARTASVFGQGTWHVTQGLRLVGSLRYTDTDKRASFSELLISGAPLNPITQAHGHINEGDIDPSVTLQYDFTPRIMGYLTYGQGSKSGGFLSNTAGVTDSTFSFRPEHSQNYEAGVKSTLFDGHLVADVSIYNTHFKDLQVSALNPETLNFVTGNAASATSRGVEWTLTWKPVAEFDITLSGAYQDAHYDDYKGASCLATETLAQCDPNDPASIAQNNIKGVPLEFASKWTGGVQAHYTHPLPYDLVFDGTLGAAGRSGYYASDDYDPTYGYQPSYVKVDARLQVGPQDKRWHIAVIGKNLNDAKTFSYAIPWPAPITNDPRAIRYLEETRNIAIEIGAKF